MDAGRQGQEASLCFLGLSPCLSQGAACSGFLPDGWRCQVVFLVCCSPGRATPQQREVGGVFDCLLDPLSPMDSQAQPEGTRAGKF